MVYFIALFWNEIADYPRDFELLCMLLQDCALGLSQPWKYQKMLKSLKVSFRFSLQPSILNQKQPYESVHTLSHKNSPDYLRDFDSTFENMRKIGNLWYIYIRIMFCSKPCFGSNEKIRNLTKKSHTYTFLFQNQYDIT